MRPWACRHHNIGAHDAFLSYRVFSEAPLAKALVEAIERVGMRQFDRPVNVFWDKNCLNHAEDWKVGFVNGLRESRFLIYLISETSLNAMVATSLLHSTSRLLTDLQVQQDNVLVEIEEGLVLADEGKATIIKDQIYKPFDGSFFSAQTYPDVIHKYSGKSVRSTMTEFFKINGLSVPQEPTQPDQIRFVVKRILQRLNPNDGPRDWNHQIPPVVDYFTGRDVHLDQIDQSLFENGVSLVIRHPGMGKSSVAAKYARDHLLDYKYIFWMSCESSGTADIAFERLASQLNLSIPFDPIKKHHDMEDIRRVVSHWLQTNGGYLLVVDNADNPEIVGTCFQQVTTFRGNVLVTSRHDHVLSFLHIHQCDAIEIDSWDEATTMSYLETRVKKVIQRGDNSVQQILDFLDGYPLAIAQAANYIVYNRLEYSEFVADMKQALASEKMFGSFEKRGSIGAIFQLFKRHCLELQETGIAALGLLAAVSFVLPTSLPTRLFEEILKTNNQWSQVKPREVINVPVIIIWHPKA